MIEKLLKIASVTDPLAQEVIQSMEEIETSPFADDAKREQREILQYADDLMPKLAYRLGLTISELDNVLEMEVEKLAEEKIPLMQSQSFGGYAARAGAGIGSNAVQGIATALLNDLYHSAKGAITEKRNFNRMMEHNPDLAEKDPERIRSIFKTLHVLGGPELSGDPNIASAVVRFNAFHDSGFDMSNMKDLAGVRKNLDDAKSTLKAPTGTPGLDILNSLHSFERNQLSRDSNQHKMDRDPSVEQAQQKHLFEHEDRAQRRQGWATESVDRANSLRDQEKGKADAYWEKIYEKNNLGRGGGGKKPYGETHSAPKPYRPDYRGQ